MPGAPIVIEVSLPSPPEAGLATLTAACTRAALGARCVLAKDAREEVPSAVAIVTFQSEDKVRVEVGVRHGDRDVWRTSEFSFLVNDESGERWRAIGFAIGTLAESEQNGEPASGTPDVPTAPGAPSASAPLPSAASPPPGASRRGEKPAATSPAEGRPSAGSAHRSPARSGGIFLDGAGLVGRGLDPGPLRAGGSVELVFSVPRTDALLAVGGSLSGTLGERDELRMARWFDLSLAAGWNAAGDPGRSGFELLAQGFLERFDVRAESADARSESRGRWLFGAEATARGRLGLSSSLCLTADLRLASLSGVTSLRVADHTVAESPTLRYSAGLGLRVRLR